MSTIVQNVYLHFMNACTSVCTIVMSTLHLLLLKFVYRHSADACTSVYKIVMSTIVQNASTCLHCLYMNFILQDVYMEYGTAYSMSTCLHCLYFILQDVYIHGVLSTARAHVYTVFILFFRMSTRSTVYVQHEHLSTLSLFYCLGCVHGVLSTTRAGGTAAGAI